MMLPLIYDCLLPGEKAAINQQGKGFGSFWRCLLPQLADFLLDASRASEFEVFPQAATLPQEEETTGELLTLVTVIFLQQGF